MASKVTGEIKCRKIENLMKQISENMKQILENIFRKKGVFEGGGN